MSLEINHEPILHPDSRTEYCEITYHWCCSCYHVMKNPDYLVAQFHPVVMFLMVTSHSIHFVSGMSLAMTKYFFYGLDISISFVLVRHIGGISQAYIQVEIKKDVGPSGEEHKGTLPIVGFSPWSFHDVYDQPY